MESLIIKFTNTNAFVCTAYLRSGWFEAKDNYSTYGRRDRKKIKNHWNKWFYKGQHTLCGHSIHKIM